MIAAGGFDGLIQSMKHKELRVSTTAEQSGITPATGKRLRVFGFWASQMVGSSVAATLRASLSFGTDGVTHPDKVLASYRLSKGEDTQGICMTGVSVIGEKDEPITLTNMTFSSGSVITRVVVYYLEE